MDFADLDSSNLVGKYKVRIPKDTFIDVKVTNGIIRMRTGPML